MCDIVIYKKKYIFGHRPFSGTEILRPLEFLVMQAIKVSFGMLMRYNLD